MFHETEVPDDLVGTVVIADYQLRIFDKDKSKIILNRYITNKDLAIKLFNEQVNIYHKLPIRVIISLYDMNKCTNIEYYDSDDNI